LKLLSKLPLAFRRAIALLSQAGVSICFYRTPVTGGYEETSKVIPNSRYDEYADYIRELAQEYKSALVGYKELSYDFGDSRFMNQDHLNTSSLRDVWPMVERACKKMTPKIKRFLGDDLEVFQSAEH
jgi:hypothetical protein